METENKINACCQQGWRDVGSGQGRIPAAPWPDPSVPSLPCPAHAEGWVWPWPKAKTSCSRAGSSGRGAKGSVEARPWCQVPAHPRQSKPRVGASCPAPAPASDRAPAAGSSCHGAVCPSIHPLPVPVPVPRALAPAAVAEASLISRFPHECGSSPGTGFISRRRT